MLLVLLIANGMEFHMTGAQLEKRLSPSLVFEGLGIFNLQRSFSTFRLDRYNIILLQRSNNKLCRVQHHEMK